MTNIAIFKSLIDRYTKVAYAHNYIWGFTYKHNVYMAVTDASYVETLCCLDKASRGEGWALRFRPNSAQKLAILPNSKLLCSEDFFMETVQGCVYNKGEVFEKMVTEYFGQEWKKDNVPFTKAGDIEVNGIPYQIKYQQATFCNEKSIASLEKQACYF